MFHANGIFVPLGMACASMVFGVGILYVARGQKSSNSRKQDEEKREQIGVERNFRSFQQFIRILFMEGFPLLCLAGSLSFYFSQWTGLWLFLWILIFALRIFSWASRQ